MVIRTGPERVSNDASPKLGGDLDLNGNDITVGVGGVALNQATITSSTTDDFNIDLISTLNDAAAAGGSDSFSLIKGELTLTDSTGWDEILLMNLQVDGNTIMRLDPINASLAFGDYGVGDFQISSADQNPATDNAGVSLTLYGGAAGSATTGAAGGPVQLKGGDAGGSGDNDGGGVAIYPGSPTGSGETTGLLLWDTSATTNAAFNHDGTDLQISNTTAGGGVAFLDDSFAEILFIDGNELSYAGRRLDNQGADVASANDLTLGSDGNCFEITGTTQVNRIVNTGWQNGSKVTLLFTSTPTVKHAQASAGANIIILLAGAADFVASAGDTLTLMLCEIGGTQAWREVARAVI